MISRLINSEVPIAVVLRETRTLSTRDFDLAYLALALTNARRAVKTTDIEHIWPVARNVMDQGLRAAGSQRRRAVATS